MGQINSIIESLGVKKDENIPNIGFDKRNNMWYGWHANGIRGFGIGYIVREIDALTTSFPVGFKAETLDDCKRMAIVFAEKFR